MKRLLAILFALMVGCSNGRSPEPSLPESNASKVPNYSPGIGAPQIIGKQITIELGNGVKMEFVRIPKGTFKMGSPAGEKGRQEEEFQHEVEISKDFYLGKFPVTQEQYEVIMGKNPSGNSAAGGDKDEVKGMDTRNFPVEQVTWDDAKAFCDKLTQHDPQGRKCALPTEAEWEYACRGGKTTVFCWGDECNGTQANCDGRNPYGTQANGPFLGRPTIVGSYERDHLHPWGLCDMHGNVWQWCADWYGKDYYKESRRVDPLGPSTGEGHVVRGGSYYDRPVNCRCARRSWGFAAHRVANCGFRVVLRLE